MKKTLLCLALVGLSATTFSVYAEKKDTVKAKIEGALKLEHRTEADKKRDQNRNPTAALEFMGLKDDMKVIEFAPGGGWYTKILAPVLKDQGELILAGKKEWMVGLDNLLKGEDFSKVKKVSIDMDWNNELRELSFGKINFKTKNADMFLNIRMYHNLPDADRASFNKAVFKSLKPGGTYVVITHSRRHMQGNSDENWRREDPVRVIKELLDAGFTFEKYSDMFYRPDDELRYEVGRKTVTGNTDRFFFVFKKPKK